MHYLVFPTQSTLILFHLLFSVRFIIILFHSHSFEHERTHLDQSTYLGFEFSSSSIFSLSFQLFLHHFFFTYINSIALLHTFPFFEGNDRLLLSLSKLSAIIFSPPPFPLSLSPFLLSSPPTPPFSCSLPHFPCFFFLFLMCRLQFVLLTLSLLLSQVTHTYIHTCT